MRTEKITLANGLPATLYLLEHPKTAKIVKKCWQLVWKNPFALSPPNPCAQYVAEIPLGQSPVYIVFRAWVCKERVKEILEVTLGLTNTDVELVSYKEKLMIGPKNVTFHMDGLAVETSKETIIIK